MGPAPDAVPTLPADTSTSYTTPATSTAAASTSSTPGGTPWYASLATAVGAVLPGITSDVNTSKVLNAQLQLAKSGKPPLTDAEISSLQTSPGYAVNFGLTGSTQYAMLAVAIGLGALLIIPRLMGRPLGSKK